jgi:hypothetical protein
MTFTTSNEPFNIDQVPSHGSLHGECSLKSCQWMPVQQASIVSIPLPPLSLGSARIYRFLQQELCPLGAKEVDSNSAKIWSFCTELLNQWNVTNSTSFGGADEKNKSIQEAIAKTIFLAGREPDYLVTELRRFRGLEAINQLDDFFQRFFEKRLKQISAECEKYETFDSAKAKKVWKNLICKSVAEFLVTERGHLNIGMVPLLEEFLFKVQGRFGNELRHLLEVLSYAILSPYQDLGFEANFLEIEPPIAGSHSESYLKAMFGGDVVIGRAHVRRAVLWALFSKVSSEASSLELPVRLLAERLNRSMCDIGQMIRDDRFQRVMGDEKIDFTLEESPVDTKNKKKYLIDGEGHMYSYEEQQSNFLMGFIMSMVSNSPPKFWELAAFKRACRLIDSGNEEMIGKRILQLVFSRGIEGKVDCSLEGLLDLYVADQSNNGVNKEAALAIQAEEECLLLVKWVGLLDRFDSLYKQEAVKNKIKRALEATLEAMKSSNREVYGPYFEDSIHEIFNKALLEKIAFDGDSTKIREDRGDGMFKKIESLDEFHEFICEVAESSLAHMKTIYPESIRQFQEKIGGKVEFLERFIGFYNVENKKCNISLTACQQKLIELWEEVFKKQRNEVFDAFVEDSILVRRSLRSSKSVDVFTERFIDSLKKSIQQECHCHMPTSLKMFVESKLHTMEDVARCVQVPCLEVSLEPITEQQKLLLKEFVIKNYLIDCSEEQRAELDKIEDGEIHSFASSLRRKVLECFDVPRRVENHMTNELATYLVREVLEEKHRQKIYNMAIPLALSHFRAQSKESFYYVCVFNPIFNALSLGLLTEGKKELVVVDQEEWIDCQGIVPLE